MAESSETPEQLKRRIISNNSLKTMLSSRQSSGTSTPTKIEKTDSVINLTKPSLYSIYNDNSATALNKDDDDDSLYVTTTNINGSTNPNDANTNGGNKVKENIDEETGPLFEGPLSILLVKFLVKLLILAMCAHGYNEITSHIHNDHIKLDKHTFQPLYLTQLLLTNSFKNLKPLSYVDIQVLDMVNYSIVLVIQGMIMGLMHPLLDFVMPPEHNRRILSSNPDPRKTTDPSTMFNDILRLLITFLGISYAIRNLEWSSPLQASVVWSLLCPCLWLLLDGTLAGLLAGFCITVYGCLFLYLTNISTFHTYASLFQNKEEFIPIWLWTSSFFFCGLIIFGKVSRALFY